MREGWIPKGQSGPCADCGTVFVAKRRDRLCCSADCARRYARTQRSYVRVPVDERFWRYVTAGDPGECWEWQGHRDHRGYGRLQSPGQTGPVLKAHRVSYELHCGPIPDGLHILHSCDNPPCVNPAHLRPGTPADNVQDKMDRGRFRNGGRYIHSDELAQRVYLSVLGGGPIGEVAEAFGVKPRWVAGVVSGERRRDAIQALKDSGGVVGAPAGVQAQNLDPKESRLG